MSRHRWTWMAGATGMLVLALGWRVTVETAPKKPVDWVKINPVFAGATYVNDPEKCAECHEQNYKTFAGTKHAHALASGSSRTEGESCESCHGPMSKHLDDADDTVKITDPKAQAAICLQCHESGARFSWKAGPHHSSETSCTSCHYTMEKRSERALLLKPTVTETCYQCHKEVRADQSKMSHHPVREGRMDCASCHNSHGSTPGLLIKATVNDTCFSCHADKRGPFVWEHAPVREACVTCHTPHGSNQRNLLTSKDPFLCMSCHSYGGHVNLPRYNRVSSPYGSGCSNCHITTHGSNHPSGAKFTR